MTPRKNTPVNMSQETASLGWQIDESEVESIESQAERINDYLPKLYGEEENTQEDFNFWLYHIR